MTNKLPYINPLLIAAAPVLFLWNHNFAEVFMWEVFPSLVVLLVFAVATFGVFWVLYRDPHKASFLASVTLVLALFFFLIGLLGGVWGGCVVFFFFCFWRGPEPPQKKKMKKILGKKRGENERDR